MKNMNFVLQFVKLVLAILLGGYLGYVLIPKGMGGVLLFVGLCIIIGFLFSKVNIKK